MIDQQKQNHYISWKQLKKKEKKTIGQTSILRHKDLPFMEIKSGAEKAYSIRRHSHGELAFGFVEEGSSRILCHPLEFDLVVNDAILIPPEIIHLCQPGDTSQFKFKMLFVDPEWIQETFGLDTPAIKAQKSLLSPQDLKLKSQFFYGFTSDQDPLQRESNAVLFFARLLFDIFCLAPVKEKKLKKNILLAKNYLDHNFTQNIQLGDLEKICNQSKFSILRKFSQTYHLTPHAYVLNKRINLAKSILRKNHTVADTAVMCGFFDQSHFVKTFRKYVGVNPVDYKRPFPS